MIMFSSVAKIQVSTVSEIKLSDQLCPQVRAGEPPWLHPCPNPYIFMFFGPKTKLEFFGSQKLDTTSKNRVRYGANRIVSWTHKEVRIKINSPHAIVQRNIQIMLDASPFPTFRH